MSLQSVLFLLILWLASAHMSPVPKYNNGRFSGSINSEFFDEIIYGLGDPKSYSNRKIITNSNMPQTSNRNIVVSQDKDPQVDKPQAPINNDNHNIKHERFVRQPTLSILTSRKLKANDDDNDTSNNDVSKERGRNICKLVGADFNRQLLLDNQLSKDYMIRIARKINQDCDSI